MKQSVIFHLFCGTQPPRGLAIMGKIANISAKLTERGLAKTNNILFPYLITNFNIINLNQNILKHEKNLTYLCPIR